jgi:hypothetical protein
MLIKILRSSFGTEDGRVVYLYPAGMTLEVAESLASHFIQRGWAVRINHNQENKNADR